MSYAEHSPEDRLTAGDLVSDLLSRTLAEGPNESEWPGLTTYRFSRPQPPQWSEVRSLALCYVVQGHKRFVVDGREYACDPSRYLLFTRGMRFEAEILEASAARPYLSFVLQIDPSVVGSLSLDLAGGAAPVDPPAAPEVSPAAHVSGVRPELRGAVRRFLRSLATEADRTVLAPMHLREVVYRLMQADQVSRLLHAAVTERESSPVSELIRYVHGHLSEPMTVAGMARRVRMSPSALTAVFVEATGVGPYQFLKRARLNRAGALLMQTDLNVSEVAREVGYVSLSHFINEFKRHFGATPGAYAATQRLVVPMRVESATHPVESV